jgi:ectoine hydroxylase-related dioxygenase (phytanoyl-CoA dioxygenase family)
MSPSTPHISHRAARMDGVLTEQQLETFNTDGFVLVPDVIDAAELAVLRTGVWETFPTPEDYFAEPETYAHLTDNPFAGLANFPWASPELNRLVAHPGIVSIVRQILGLDDIRLYKGELWGKYSGNTDYDQHHHRDFGNHTLVVPSVERRWMQVTTFIYLCDVDEFNGATTAVPKRFTADIPLGQRLVEPGELRDLEVLATGKAGTVLVYSTEIFHRGTSMTGTDVSRFTVLADYRAADATWTSKQAFGNQGNRPEMIEFVTNVDVDTRTLLDIPAPGHPYWTDQTIADMTIRYPGIDMTPYRDFARLAPATDLRHAPGSLAVN